MTLGEFIPPAMKFLADSFLLFVDDGQKTL